MNAKQNLTYYKSILIRGLILESGYIEKKLQLENATLNYIRTHYDGYDYKRGDKFDIEILSVLKRHFNSVNLNINEPILFEEQLNLYKQIGFCISKQSVKVILTPNISLLNSAKSDISIWKTKTIDLVLNITTNYSHYNLSKKDDKSVHKFILPLLESELEKISSTIMKV